MPVYEGARAGRLGPSGAWCYGAQAIRRRRGSYLVVEQQAPNASQLLWRQELEEAVSTECKNLRGKDHE